MRFDDTNPSKENQDFVYSILEDVKKLGVEYDTLSHTSDNFSYFFEKADFLIKKGLAYCDNTPVEQMRKERFDGIISKCRDQTIEGCLEIFKGM